MKIKKGQFIKHQAFIDVVIKVTKCSEVHNRYKVSGNWINQGFIDSFPLNEKVELEINKDQLHQWLWCTEPSKQCLRDANWVHFKPVPEIGK